MATSSGADPRPGQQALVLVNVGTPDAPTTRSVRKYLRAFLMDGRVLDLPLVLRWLLVHLLILPFRSRRSAALYRSIWRPDGSPLLVHGRALERALAARLPRLRVSLGMAVGSPSVGAIVQRLAAEGAEHVWVLPLFPQYASATTGSVAEAAARALIRGARVPGYTVLPSFYDDPGYLDAMVAVLREATQQFAPEHVLFSYHSLPIRQVQGVVARGFHCEATEGASCCDRIRPENAFCYRAQCMATSRALAARLPGVALSTSFQSRLGSAAWLGPDTESALRALASKGKKRVAVLCPSFVADCLETLEEIGIRGQETFRAAGGEALLLVPCLNAHPAWVEALARMVERQLPREEEHGSQHMAP